MIDPFTATMDGRAAMFDIDELIADCIAALEDREPRLAVKEVLARAVSDPASIEAALPPVRAELVVLYSSAALTVLKVVWAPGMSVPPHDHLMWAAIGIYGGQEDNRFFRRSLAGLVPSGGKLLATSEVGLLGAEAIHAVTNPRGHDYTGAIHVYGGDFPSKERSMWDVATGQERQADGETMRGLFEEANARTRTI